MVFPRRGPLHAGPARRSPGWIAVLAIALVSAAFAATVWHGDHADDQDCAVCQIRHQPVAELSVNLEVGPADAADLIEQIPADNRAAPDRFSRLPARAPPAG